jgi:FkbM family methyltransferase
VINILPCRTEVVKSFRPLQEALRESRFVRAAARRKDEGMLAHLREALKDALPPRLVHAYRLVRHTMWWPTELEMVAARQFLAKDKIAVDAGANVGLFTAVLARRSRRVIAFEPNPVLARHLAKVVPRNCEVIAKAVSDREGIATLRVPLADGIAMDALATVSATNRFETEARATALATYEVPMVTLDQVLLPLTERGERVGFINIDVEGHEFAVLKGGERLIASERPVLLVELEYRHGVGVEEVFNWFKARHYMPRVLADGKALTAIDPAGLRVLQDPSRLSRRLAGDRHAGYVNNVFFLPLN